MLLATRRTAAVVAGILTLAACADQPTAPLAPAAAGPRPAPRGRADPNRQA